MNRNVCRREATGLWAERNPVNSKCLKEKETTGLARALLLQLPLMLARLRPPSLVLFGTLVLGAAFVSLHRAGADNSAVLLLAAAAGLGAAVALLPRSERAVRHEREVVGALGEPLIAAHPATREGLRALCEQLRAQWLAHGRRLLPVVQVGEGDFAADLARAFAAAGERTLLVDADLRSPALHRRFRLPRGEGLADFLDGRGLRLAACGENLALLGAGTARELPLELLSRQRLRQLLDAMAAAFAVVVVRTPPVARGPDFEIFAALACGALVYAGRGAGAGELAALRLRLERCAARVLGTVLGRG